MAGGGLEEGQAVLMRSQGRGAQTGGRDESSRAHAAGGRESDELEQRGRRQEERCEWKRAAVREECSRRGDSLMMILQKEEHREMSGRGVQCSSPGEVWCVSEVDCGCCGRRLRCSRAELTRSSLARRPLLPSLPLVTRPRSLALPCLAQPSTCHLPTTPPRTAMIPVVHLHYRARSFSLLHHEQLKVNDSGWTD